MFDQLENEDDKEMLKQLKLISKNQQDRQQLIKILKFFLCYPSNRLAKLHSKASKFGKLDQRKTRQQFKRQYTSNSETYSVCQCCNYLVRDQGLKCCYSMRKIVTLGEATKLFFNDIKFAILIMISSIIIYGVYSLITNVIASRHNTDSCIKQKTCKIAMIGLGSKLSATYSWQNTQLYVGQVYLGLLMSIVWGILFILKTFRERKITKQSDKLASTASDFTVMFTHLPKSFTKQNLQIQLDRYAQTVKNMLIYPQQQLNSQTKYDGKFTISNYNPVRAYYQTLKIAETMTLNFEQMRLNTSMQKLRNLILERQGKQYFSIPQNERNFLYQTIDELKVKITSQRIQKLKIIQERYRKWQVNQDQIVFVTFNHTYAKVNLLKLHQFSLANKIKSCLIKTQKKNAVEIQGLEIERAPQPQDVIWQNIGVSSRQLFVRRMLTYLITFILLGASFAAIYGISKAQQSNNSVIISFGLSLVINVINILLNTFIQILTTYQKDYTTTNYQISIAFKITAAQLINSVVISIIAAKYIKGNIYQSGGLVDDVFYFSLLNSFIPPLLRVINVYFIFLRALRYWFSMPQRKLRCQSQVQFNKKWQDTEFEIGLQYVYILKTVIYTAFFLSLQPVICVFALIGICLMFYAEKIALFYQSFRPKPSSNIITLSMNSILYLSIIAYGFGSLTWTNFLPHQQLKHTLMPNIICICIGVLLYFITFGQVADMFISNTYASLSYQKQKILLPSEYDRLNPSTKREAVKKFIKYLEQRKKQQKSILTSTKELQQQDDNQRQLLFYQQLLIQNNKYKQQLDEQQNTLMNDNYDIGLQMKSEQSPEKLIDNKTDTKCLKRNSYIKKQSQKIRSTINRIQNIEPIDSSRHLCKNDEDLKINTQHLQSILNINSLPRQHRPSILSSKFNPIDFLDAFHSGSNQQLQ